MFCIYPKRVKAQYAEKYQDSLNEHDRPRLLHKLNELCQLNRFRGYKLVDIISKSSQSFIARAASLHEANFGKMPLGP